MIIFINLILLNKWLNLYQKFCVGIFCLFSLGIIRLKEFNEFEDEWSFVNFDFNVFYVIYCKF